MSRVGIIDYGMGNIASVRNALEHIGMESVIVHDPSLLETVDKLILPGVGAFAMAMENLREKGFIAPLNESVIAGEKPLLGLCLGMQLLFDSSEEFGDRPGLGWISGKVRSLKTAGQQLPVPHMGWNNLHFLRESPLMAGIPESEADVYFVHSFFCEAEDRTDVIATVDYGMEIDVIVQKKNLFGCQFHPEKSQKTGLQLLRNFCSL